MIDFIQLQKVIKKHLERDRLIRTVDASGPTLDAAVNEAASLLDTSIRHLDYEIVERGSSGFLGAGKKDWVIRAYQHEQVKKVEEDEDLFVGEEEEDVEVIADKDGDVYVQYRQDGGVYMKVTAPVGNGRKVYQAAAMQALQTRNVADFDEKLIETIVEKADSEYVKIAEFPYNRLNDTTVSVEVDDAEMNVTIMVFPPGENGADLVYDDYISLLKQNRVHYGVKEEYLTQFADRPTYREKVFVAEGTKPVNGKDAYIQYNFETDQSKISLKEGANGRINFKELNIINNVVQNQPVAKKMPAGNGVDGKSITGKILPAKDGNDIPLPLGSNVHVGDDGETIFSDINGQVLLIGDKINVEPVFTVEGDVNLKTGNIIFLGTVIITGNIEDGFTVKAAGNIEVKGTVSKAELDAEGDILLHQGVNGKGGGKVRAGKTIWSRFIENANVEAGSMVFVTDGIINSYVDAIKSITCMGKRANIMGGRLRAGEEISANVLGNPTSGTETICEVGFDPNSIKELERLMAEKSTLEEEADTVKLDLQTLINTKKQRKNLPEDKEAYLQELMERRQILTDDLKSTVESIEKIQQYMNEMQVNGKVSAAKKVYPGVKIIIRDAKEDVRTEYRATTFILENGLVRATMYEEPDNEFAKKGLDGYNSN
ncbi:MAG: FapA family protein [Spirochaetes bacterium]|nr:FapA family protein [Spirochaetota bacterium]